MLVLSLTSYTVFQLNAEKRVRFILFLYDQRAVVTYIHRWTKSCKHLVNASRACMQIVCSELNNCFAVMQTNLSTITAGLF